MIYTIVVVFIISIIFTLFDDTIAKLLLPTSDTNGIKTEWIGFWGNILGSLIQGITTAMGIVASIYMFNKEKENSQLQEKENNNKYFFENFGKVTIAFKKILHISTHYDNLNDFYDNYYVEFEELTQEIKDGEITAFVGSMRNEISWYIRRREQGLFVEERDSSYETSDGRIKKNIRKLKALIELKNEVHLNQYMKLTGIDLKEWDKGKIVEMEGVSLSATSNIVADGTVIRNGLKE